MRRRVPWSAVASPMSRSPCGEQLAGQRVGLRLRDRHARTDPVHDDAERRIGIELAHFQRPGGAQGHRQSRVVVITPLR